MRCLVTGATGYIGGRLVPELLAAGHEVRVLARHVERLADRPWAGEVEIVSGDAGDPEAVASALSGMDVAYYLLHSMLAGGDFHDVERRIAQTFAAAARAEGISRIVYLGALHPDAPDEILSEHFRGRAEVGEILRASGVPTVELRAAVIIGSGSASFEMTRYLTERLPAMVTPAWVQTPTQPIAIRDVLYYLVHAADLPPEVNRTFDIGGPDVITYELMMQGYARAAGLRKRLVIRMPLGTPALSTHWVTLITPVPKSVAAPLVESVTMRTVCNEHDIEQYIPDPPEGLVSYERAVQLALAKIRQADVGTAWSSSSLPGAPSDPLPSDPDWAGGALYLDDRSPAGSGSHADAATPTGSASVTPSTSGASRSGSPRSCCACAGSSVCPGSPGSSSASTCRAKAPRTRSRRTRNARSSTRAASTATPTGRACCPSTASSSARCSATSATAPKPSPPPPPPPPPIPHEGAPEGLRGPSGSPTPRLLTGRTHDLGSHPHARSSTPRRCGCSRTQLRSHSVRTRTQVRRQDRDDKDAGRCVAGIATNSPVEAIESRVELPTVHFHGQPDVIDPRVRDRDVLPGARDQPSIEHCAVQPGQSKHGNEITFGRRRYAAVDELERLAQKATSSPRAIGQLHPQVGNGHQPALNRVCHQGKHIRRSPQAPRGVSDRARRRSHRHTIDAYAIGRHPARTFDPDVTGRQAAALVRHQDVHRRRVGDALTRLEVLQCTAKAVASRAHESGQHRPGSGVQERGEFPLMTSGFPALDEVHSRQHPGPHSAEFSTRRRATRDAYLGELGGRDEPCLRVCDVQHLAVETKWSWHEASTDRIRHHLGAEASPRGGTHPSVTACGFSGESQGPLRPFGAPSCGMVRGGMMGA